jgi:hypothetical protein
MKPPSLITGKNEPNESDPDPAIAQILEALRLAGAAGLPASSLKLEAASRAKAKAGKTPPPTPRRDALAALLADGRVKTLGNSRAPRFMLAASAPTAETVAARLLAAMTDAPPLTLWKGAQLAKKLSVAERPLLAEALNRLQDRREMVPLRHGRSSLYAAAAPLGAWLGPVAAVDDVPPAPVAVAPAAVAVTVSAETLFSTYLRLVRESGGFPDVKISRLHRALGQPTDLADRLIDLWREGRADLSLGDWSLADEETRSAAVTLDGERYLLVRLEDANDSPG